MSNRYVFLIAIFLTGCVTYGKKPLVTRHVYGVHRAEKIHVVRRKETLYSIAWEAGMDYRTVAKINHLNAHYHIHVGQRLVLRSALEKHFSVSHSHKVVILPRIEKSRIVWQWPVRGHLLRCFSPHGMMNKGVDIAAKKGTPVVAAAAGKVVYSGNGLKGYGNLLIIKHDAEYLSAYAHNRRLWVKEGRWVKAGQKIAEVGNSDSRQVVLHFEIRRAGKPVNPLLFLR